MTSSYPDGVGRWIEGWVISVVAHSIIAGLATLLMAELKYVPEKEVFRWEVALVQPQVSEPSPSTESPPPSSPSVSPATPPPTPSRTPAPQRVETKQVVQTTPPEPTPVIAQPIERQTIDRKPLEQAQPVTQPDVIRRVETIEPHPVETARAQERQPAVEERREVEEPATAVVTRPHNAPSVQTREPVTSASVQDAAPVSKEVATRDVAAVESAQPVTQTATSVETAAVQSAEAVTTIPPADTSASSPVLRQAAPAAAESPSPVIAPNQTPPPETSAARERAEDRVLDRAPMTTAAVRPVPGARADFGWLTQALWRRIEQLKRYPHKARMNRWEGTVVVRAVISKDGSFAELTMEKSSGHEVLDEDAIDLLRKASPLTLKHELGRPELTIRIPISYKLE